MKKILLLLMFCYVSHIALAQRYAIIDMKYILSKIPEYKQVDVKIESIAEHWQKDLDNIQLEIDQMNRNFKVEQYFLTDELKNKRMIEIENKEKELRDLQTQRFGYQGDIFKQREILVRPIEDRIFNAIQRLSIAKGYDIVFDRSEGITVVYSDPKLDKSDDVLKELGIQN